jgi:hypothetical protein
MVFGGFDHQENARSCYCEANEINHLHSGGYAAKIYDMGWGDLGWIYHGAALEASGAEGRTAVIGMGTYLLS